MKPFLCSLLVFLFFTEASYGFAEKNFSFYGLYNFYSDIRQDSSIPPQPLSEDISLNLDYRVYRIFLMMLHGGASLNGERTYWGLGFKVDLPGFFLIAANVQELLRKHKRSAVNTSIYWKNYVLSQEGQSTTFVGNRAGLMMDIFLVNKTFLILDLGLYSDNGNQYFAYSFGLGSEF